MHMQIICKFLISYAQASRIRPRPGIVKKNLAHDHQSRKKLLADQQKRFRFIVCVWILIESKVS